MSLILWLVVFAFIFFRWPILERYIGTKRMFLFDAIIFTILAAINISQPGPWPWLGYIVGGLGVWCAFDAGILYLKIDEIQRIEDEQGKSDSGTT